MKLIYLLVLIWVAMVWLTAWLSPIWIQTQHQLIGITFATPATWAWWPLANFDGEHYLAIATRGYRQYEFALFPFYPLVVFLISRLIGDVLISGLVVSLVSTLVLIWLLFQLFSLDYDRTVVTKGLVLLLAFPTAFYLLAVYNESLFLVLVVGSFLAARRQKWWLAALLGLTSATTRLVGVWLWPALSLGHQSKRAWKWWLLILLGIGLVMLIDYQLSGSALTFVTDQTKFNSTRSYQGMVLLPQVVWRYFKILSTVPVSSLAFGMAAQELGLTLLVVGLLLIFWRRMRPEYWIFSLGAILVPTLTGTFSSMPRYVLAAFPLFFVVAKLVTSRWWFGVIVGILLLIQLINIMLFANGYFVA